MGHLKVCIVSVEYWLQGYTLYNYMYTFTHYLFLLLADIGI